MTAALGAEQPCISAYPFSCHNNRYLNPIADRSHLVYTGNEAYRRATIDLNGKGVTGVNVVSAECKRTGAGLIRIDPGAGGHRRDCNTSFARSNNRQRVQHHFQ